MAPTAGKRLTRKQIRQPDWFQVNSEMALEYYEGHQVQVLLAAVALIALLLGIWAWQSYKERQNIAAAQEFARAVELYQAEKFADAATAFEQVQAYRWSHYASLAYLYQANSYLATNQLEKALSAAQRYVSATNPGSLYRQISLVTLASAEERKNQCKQAIDHYTEAEKIAGAFKTNALLGKARCAEQLGDIKTALSAYRESLTDSPAGSIVVKIAELEAKVVSPPAAK
jgi:predicted negative regulator of RcsB-dependent stress response